MPRISNMNSVLINNQGNYETLAVIRELKKLGIIKGSKPKPKPSPKMIEDVKQPSDMVGYVKYSQTLPQITPGMTQDQIEDIQRTQAAQFAALKNEVQQGRIEDMNRTANALFSIINPSTEKFRSNTSTSKTYFPTSSSDVIYLADAIPDTQEKRFTQTLNEGAPKTTEQIQTDVFPSEEPEVIEISPPPRIQPQQRIVRDQKPKPNLVLDKQDVSDELGLGKVPTMRNSYTAIENYYISLTDLGVGERDATFNSKSQILAEINSLLEAGGKL